MNSKVKVSANEKGQVVVPSENNPEYGHIRVTQDRMFIDENGFARKKTMSALIAGTVDVLNGFGWSANQEVEGKIIVKESLSPFNAKDPARDYKVAGKTGVVCKHDDMPIYRKCFYTLDATASDSAVIPHTNSEEIIAARVQTTEKEGFEL